MTLLHIANTFLEWELAQNTLRTSLQAAFEAHPVFLHLQFLPFLYADPQDVVAVTHLPHADFFSSLKKKGITPPHIHLLSEKKEIPCERIESWGASRLISTWAQKHKIPYAMPPWEIVSLVNSKAFSFEEGVKLPGSALLYNAQDLQKWADSLSGPKVLKTCFGLSGQGHFHLEDPSLYPSFITSEWQANRPILAEPWVNRLLDFSTQWVITKTKEIHYVGSTICENDSKGRYRRNTVGDEKELFGQHLPFLAAHKTTALALLQKMADLGFFGNVGIDAMLYIHSTSKAEIHLHPIVEINARKTMGWVALEMQRRHFPGKVVTICSVTTSENFLLPLSIYTGKKEVFFKRSRNLEVEIKEVYN